MRFPFRKLRDRVQHEARPFGPAHHFSLTEPHPAEFLPTPRSQQSPQPARRPAARPARRRRRRNVCPDGREAPAVFTAERAESRRSSSPPADPRSPAGQQLGGALGVFQTKRRSSDLHRPHLPPAQKHDRNGADREPKGTGGTEPQIPRRGWEVAETPRSIGELRTSSMHSFSHP